MIYITPDQKFNKYIAKNSNMLLVTISDTNSQYDSNPVIGVINTSANFPNNRPNFFDATQSLVVTLMTNWVGYPPNLGNISFRGLEGEDKLEAPKEIPYQAPKPVEEMYQKPIKEPIKEPYIKPQRCNSLSSLQLYILFLALIVIIVMFLFFSRY